MAGKIETYRGTAFPWEIDPMGHMNTRFYAAKFDDATWHFLGALGLTIPFLKESETSVAAVQQNFTYKREVFPGTLLVVHSNLLEIGSRKFRYVHRMIDITTEEEVAKVEQTGVYYDPKTKQGRDLPQDVTERAEAMLA